MKPNVQLNLELYIKMEKGAAEVHHLGVSGGEGAADPDLCYERNIFDNVVFSQVICSRTI